MNVNISGTVLSSLFYEHGNSGCDVDGFLLGKVVQHFTDTISDAHMKRTKEHTKCYIYSFIPCRKLFTWYDGAGSLKTEELKKIVGEDRLKDVVGWYKFRRGSSLRPSLREQTIHHHLTDGFPTVTPENFVFLLCAPTQSGNKATHDMEHVFLKNVGKEFSGLPVTVSNLGDTVNSEYRTEGSSTVSTESGVLNDTLNQLRPTFEEPGGQIHSVTGIRTLNLSLHHRLQEVCSTVIASEAELRGLRETVRTLKARLKPKPAPGSVTQTSKGGPGPSSVQSSAVTSGLSPTNPFTPEILRSAHTAKSANQSPAGFSLTPDLYPQDKNPFSTSKSTNGNPVVAPSSELNLISLEDDDKYTTKTTGSHPTNNHYGNDVDSLLDFSQSLIPPPIAPNSQPRSLSTDDFAENSANGHHEKNNSDSDSFGFLSDVLKKTAKPSGSRRKAASKPAQEAIEVSSDEEQVIEYSTFPSSSPTF